MDREIHKISTKEKNHKRQRTPKRKRRTDLSEDGIVNFTEKLFPLAHYINDKEEMIEQVFSIMDEEKLNCMLPPILKGMTITLLKESCLNELKRMSEEEVRKVLCGEPLQPKLRKTTASPPRQLDSNKSLRSTVHCEGADKDSKTLLDILELEMQEIAYNTVLKKNLVTSPPESDDEAPVVVGVNLGSSSSEKRDVPLICLDSEDEGTSSLVQEDEPVILSTEASDLHLSQELDSHKLNSCPQSNAGPNFDPIKEREQYQGSNAVEENNLSDGNPSDTIENDIIVITSKMDDNNSLNLQPTISSHENLIVTLSKEISPTVSVSKDHHRHCRKVITDDKKMCNNLQPLSRKCKGIQSECKKVILSSLNNEDSFQSFQEQNADIVIPSPSPCLETCEAETHLSPDTKENTLSSAENCLRPLECEEKEEGEISEEDVQTSKTEENVPLVSLNLDENNISSKSERHEKKNIQRHLRRRRHRDKPVESPGPSRHIEKHKTCRNKRKILPSSNHSKTSNKESEPLECSSYGEKHSSPSSENICSTTVPQPTTAEDNSSQEKEESSLKPSDANCSNEDILSTSVNESSTIQEKSESLEELDNEEEMKESEGMISDPTKTSWADRWAEKKNFKRVVTTSKIYCNARKRLLSAMKMKSSSKETDSPVTPPVPPLVLHVEGSVQEYQMLQLLVDCEDGSSNESVGGEVNCLSAAEPNSSCSVKADINQNKSLSESINQDGDC